LGVFEAVSPSSLPPIGTESSQGLLPGCFYLMTSWYRKYEIQRRSAINPSL
jgi:hypothetical protein